LPTVFKVSQSVKHQAEVALQNVPVWTDMAGPHKIASPVTALTRGSGEANPEARSAVYVRIMTR